MLRFSQYALKISKRAGILPTRTISRGASTATTPVLVLQSSQPVSPLQITLREYQEECIQSVLSYLRKGHKRLGISLATGSGKTVIFTHLIDRIASVGNASQTLILAHRRELVEQAARHCTIAYPHKHVDIEMGNHHASGAADITVASIQSIMSGDRLLKFDPLRYKLILVDEAHHIVSSQYLDVLEHFGLRHPADWNTTSVPALVGVSATFSRFDGRKLGSVIDHIVYHRDYVDMIEENWLSDVIFTTVEIKADLTRLGSGANGDFQAGALSRAINTEETNEIAVRAWMTRAKERKSTLVFCVDLSHVSNLTAKFRQHGIAAEFVTGDTPKKVRSQRVDAFRNGEFPVLLNCGVFTEGTDIPNIDCVLLARPTKSRNLLVQMIGRGMRLHKSKQNCHIIDLVAALSTGVVSTPTLFGLDPAEIVENADSQAMTELKERKEREKIREEEAARVQRQAVARRIPGMITFTDYDSVHDLIADTSGDQYVRKLSEFAWVAVGDSKFVLTTNTGNYLVIEPSRTEDSGFVVKYYRRLPSGVKSKSPYATPRVIAQGESFEHVVHAADTFAAEVFEYIFVSKMQLWRRGMASQAQVDFLNKFRPEEDQLKRSDLTKGKAGDMITRIKHGTRGIFDKASARKRVAHKAQERAEAARKRLQDRIQVGPLSDSF
ncbi:P-loop containing nucleoside triphosphate hydrolase protein [Lindgomyces ingoldianus]|uniref:P-loop containing nucleoside triphosphate hydrolase protein n=1 Tax=Lindgomyces ingoldianus TaxID=673940 RepID=A0ACB6R172_9PLEO|nr:P-loop containing nucleoside triphosphate hydrolase protein [Lindgomyces ingoldianus]KAF2472994.1 P-loop containing nucleoside triphosphate hydrolase protein [Lindgomyces ingoldianus]